MSAAARKEIPFNSSVLKWARELNGKTYEQAAKKVKVPAAKIIAWETGESTPTVKQARKLADEYKRPFLEFFAKEIPNIPKPTLAPDFRLYNSTSLVDEDNSLIEIQSWAETQRLNAIDLFEMLGENQPKLPDSIFATMSSSPDKIAEQVRAISNFSIDEQMALKSKDRHTLPSKIRSSLEYMGILVLKNYKLHKFHARGMCLFFDTLPVVVFGNEAPSAQAFTLAHELAHIVLKQSAIIGGRLEQNQKSDSARVERWCNQFAAAFLIPEKALAEKKAKPSRPHDFIPDNELSKLGSQFSVSRHAMLIRLVELNYVDANYYWSLKRAEFIKQEDELKLGGGPPDYYASRYRSSNGDLYTGLVLEAWTTGKITNHNAGEFMGIKNLSHLEAIRDHFGE
jgi:Zn-dependent peptidase ImmA (M78 family)/transcriptional regulator with XRE-family HTH domain